MDSGLRRPGWLFGGIMHKGISIWIPYAPTVVLFKAKALMTISPGIGKHVCIVNNNEATTSI